MNLEILSSLLPWLARQNTLTVKKLRLEPAWCFSSWSRATPEPHRELVHRRPSPWSLVIFPRSNISNCQGRPDSTRRVRWPPTDPASVLTAMFALVLLPPFVGLNILFESVFFLPHHWCFLLCLALDFISFICRDSRSVCPLKLCTTQQLFRNTKMTKYLWFLSLSFIPCLSFTAVSTEVRNKPLSLTASVKPCSF